MELFDEIQRIRNGPAEFTEPEFNSINLSGRERDARVRQVLEEWFSHYPVEAQSELRGRFRSSDNVQHRSTFFELFLHELFLRLRCRVELHQRRDQ